MPTDHGPAPDSGEPADHHVSAFDIRVFIASLIGIYGVVLVLTGLFSADGRGINLAAGAGMVVAAVAFVTWARLRPVMVPRRHDDAPPAGGD